MKNTYVPEEIRVERIIRETDDTWTFFFDRPVENEAGQFLEVSIPGYGEAPISINSHSSERLRLCIRAVGNLTRAMHRKKVGDTIGIRGPFGKGWPLEQSKGKNLLIVTGGIGLAPLRPAIKEIIMNRNDYGDVVLLYGARNPDLILHKKELAEWRKDIEILVTVDYCEEYTPEICPAWKGDVGVVTGLFNKCEMDTEGIALVCGPPIMMKFAAKELLSRGFRPENIHMSLERHMKCGMGMCGHCQVGGHYVCMDGPVFSIGELLSWPERPEETEGIQ